MTWHDDRDWVFPVGESDGARGGPIAELFRDIAIARRRAVGNLAQRVPHAVFECRAESFERQIEGSARAGEVFLELLSRAREQLGGRTVVGFYPARLVRRRRSTARGWEEDARESGIGGGDDELTDGGADADEGQGHSYIIILSHPERWTRRPQAAHLNRSLLSHGCYILAT